jgi:ADP-ribose pyrophosphatase YjhB (NUDIX family)
MSYVHWIRRRLGSRKIFLVFSSIILTDEYGRFLLQYRTDFKVWGLPGGVLELDEDIRQCAYRELLEETGLSAGHLRLVGVYSHPRFDVVYPNGDQVQQYTICLTGSLTGGEMQADGVEGSDLAFFEAADLERLPLPIWYRAMLADVRRGGPPAFLPPFANGRIADQIAGLRPFVGTDRVIGVGATTAVLRDDGRLLMIQRADNGAWAFPAGYSDLGENAAYTAVRETREETGYHVIPERILGVYSSSAYHHTFANGDQIKNVGTFFLARLAGGEMQIDPEEVRAAEWVRLEDVLARTPPKLANLHQQALRCLDGGSFLD